MLEEEWICPLRWIIELIHIWISSCPLRITPPHLNVYIYIYMTSNLLTLCLLHPNQFCFGTRRCPLISEPPLAASHRMGMTPFHPTFVLLVCWCERILRDDEVRAVEAHFLRCHNSSFLLILSLYSLIWDFLLSQIYIWATTTWSNVWVVLLKPSWYEFLIGFLIWTPASKYLHLTIFSNICVILSMYLYL